MAYTQETRDSFLAELAQALNDPTHIYWAVDELIKAINEALCVWGALTSYWTTRGLFNTVASTPFYDLAVELPALRARTQNYDGLTTEIQYCLLESASGVSGVGMTDQFTIGQITSALARRRNQFVLDTRIPLTFTTIPAVPPASPSQPLSNDVALIARAAWIDAVTGIVTPLRRTDSFSAQSLSPIWNLNPGKPYSYSQAEYMPGQLILIPPPAASGAIHLTYAKTVTLTVAPATSFLLPDELAWTIKYGAMYEVLSTNSQGYDPIRTKYCLERYTSGIELAKAHRSILQVRSNDKLLSLATLTDLDGGRPYWQTGTGIPGIAACAYDLVAFYRVPNAVYSITCDVSQSAPLPHAGTDFLQIGTEELPYIMDYCRHILMFKLGGTEFIQSMPLYDNFLAGAAQRSKLIAVKARYLTPLFLTPQKQESESNAA